MKKLVSLISALAICLSLCVPAFAAEPDNGLVPVAVYELKGATIKVFVGPEDRPLRTRANSDLVEGTAGSSGARITFGLESGEGDFCDVRIWNDSSSTEMEVSFSATLRVDGETVTVDRTDPVDPGNRTYLQITGKSGLEGVVKTTIRPVGASSVGYTYTADQYWK